jgi:hypothetical protein
MNINKSDTSFLTYLIRNFLSPKIEKSFFSEPFLRTLVFADLCSTFFLFTSILGLKYKSNYENFMQTLGISNPNEPRLHEYAVKQIENEVLPYLDKETFFGIVCIHLEKTIGNKQTDHSVETIFKHKDVKIVSDVAVKGAAHWIILGANLGSLYPEVVRKIYSNSEENSRLIHVLSEQTGININQKLKTDNLQKFEETEQQIFELFRDFVETNCSNELQKKLSLNGNKSAI